jgi:hypothetical protein
VTHPLFHNLWDFYFYFLFYFFWGGIEIKELRPKFLEFFVIKKPQRINGFPEIMGQELIIDWFLHLLRTEITYHIQFFIFLELQYIHMKFASLDFLESQLCIKTHFLIFENHGHICI